MNNRSLSFSVLFIGAALLLLLIMSFTVPSTDPENDVEDLQQIVTALEQGISTGNNEPWKKYMADDGILLNRDGKTNTKQEIVDEIKPLPKGKILDIRPVNMKVYLNGASAMITFLADEKLSVFNQPVDTKYPSVMYFEKRDGRWQMLFFTYFEQPVDPSPLRVDKEYLEKFTGIYRLSEESRVEIRANDTALVMKKAGSTLQGSVLYPISNDGRFFRAGTECEYIFTNDENGKPIMRQRRNWIDLVYYREN